MSYIPPHQSPKEPESSRSPESLEREVRERRHNIDELLDELGALVHPKTLMRQAVDWVRSDENRSRVRHAAAEAGESLKETSREVGRKISGRVSHLTHDATAASRDMLTKKRSQTQVGLKHARETAKAKAQDDPLSVALGILGVGFLAGMMLPKTAAERRVAEKTQETLASMAPANKDVSSRGDEVASAS